MAEPTSPPVHMPARTPDPTRPILDSVRRIRGDESGNALVLSIAAVLLTGLLMGVVFSSVMFTIGNTTANRASAESRAAAEGGAQQVARKLLQFSTDAVTYCPANLDAATLDPNGWTDYEVLEVNFRETPGAAWVECVGSTGIPKLADAVRVTTRGHTKSVGQVGNERGNEAVVEMVFARPAALDFNKAVFGSLNVNSNTNFNLYGDPVHPDRPNTQLSPDIVTNKKWTCPASGTISGSVFALGGATVSTSCVVEGDFYISGSPTIGAKLTVKGNLYIDGDLNSSSTYVDGTTLVRGNINLSAANHKFLGPVRATGLFSTSDAIPAAFSSTLHIGGKITLPPYQNITATVNGLGARFQQQQVTTGTDWLLPTILNTPENPRTPADIDEVAFPMVTKNDAVWDTFAVGDWETLSAGSRQGSRCSSYNFTKPIVISTATKIDLTDCASVTWANITLELKADVVVFVKNFGMNGSMAVKTVNAPGDETRHTLYLVALPASGQTDCTPGKGGNITFSTPGWSQLDADGKLRTKVMLYSAGKTTLSSKPAGTLNGQIYGCDVEAASGVNIVFAKAGRDFTDTLWDLGLGSVRDITRS